MKKLIQAQINEGEIVENVSGKVFKEFQAIFLHLKDEKSKTLLRAYEYKNLQDFLNDREILEGMIK